MASKDHKLKSGPFVGALNSRKQAFLLDPTEAQAATDCDLFTGGIAGTLALGSSAQVNASFPSALWVWLLGGGTWQWANDRRWAMNDGSFTYFTQQGKRAQVGDAAGNTFSLGVVPANGVSWDFTGSGSLSGSRSYGFTYETFDELESNFQPFDLTFNFTALAKTIVTFTGLNGAATIWPTDTRISKVHFWATASDGMYHRHTTVSSRATLTVVDDGTGAGSDATLLAADELTWTYGGFPNNNATLAAVPGAVAAQYTSDHAPAPVLTRLADRIHSQAAGTAIAGSGVVFGAVGNVLRWSVNGYPQYWPVVNSMPLDHNIEAIVAYSGYVVVFTTGGIYRVSGNNDDAMSMERLPAFYNIKAGAGRTCVRTPHGTIYLSTEGLAVFNGSSSQIVSSQKIAQSYWDGLTVYDAAYFGDKYYLFHSTGYLRVDLRVDLRDGWQAVRFNTSATVINCAVTADFRNPLVGAAHREIPLTASATAIGIRRSGLVSDNSSKLYIVGGFKIDLTVVPGGEVAVGTAYELDTSSASAVWAAKSSLASSQTRADWCPVYVGGKVYGFGGRSDNTGSSLFSTMQILNIAGNSWSIDSTGGGPGNNYGYSAAADTSGADTSGFWTHGGNDGSSVKSALQKFTISPAAWGANITAGPARMFHGMVYVPGSVFADGHPRLFVFGGSSSTDFADSTNSVHCLDLTAQTWTNDTSSATAAGAAARSRHVWAYNATNQNIYLHGGRGVDGAALSDIWEFDPRVWVDAIGGSQSAAWTNTSGAVVNVEDRYWHGGAFLDETLYLAGGSSMIDLFNSDLYAVHIQPLALYSTTPGVYALKPADGGNIYRVEAGAAQQWTWQTPDFVGDSHAAIKHAHAIRAYYRGDVQIGVYNDNAAVQTMITLSSATRTQVEKYLPFSGATAARAGRLSFRFLGLTAAAASSGVAGELYDAEIDISEEAGG